jgi:hypothetical protein
LIAQKSPITEEAIESVVASYVRYDPAERQVALLPAAASLSNRARVLVYLVALQGWPFVTDEPVKTTARPSEIEERLGIHGGTLRPVLKELKDRHLISSKSDGYFVQTAGLDTVRSEIARSATAAPRVRAAARPARTRTAQSESSDKGEGKNAGRKGITGKTAGLAAKFKNWVENGWFDEAKSLADVQRRSRQEGIIVPQTSLPYYLLKEVRAGRLSREEANVGGKNVWVYQRVK